MYDFFYLPQFGCYVQFGNNAEISLYIILYYI